MLAQNTQDQKDMKAISLNSARNPMKLISKILFHIYLGHRKQHWGGRKAEIFNKNFTYTYNIQTYKSYLYINLYNHITKF